MTLASSDRPKLPSTNAWCLLAPWPLCHFRVSASLRYKTHLLRRTSSSSLHSTTPFSKNCDCKLVCGLLPASFQKDHLNIGMIALLRIFFPISRSLGTLQRCLAASPCRLLRRNPHPLYQTPSVPEIDSREFDECGASSSPKSARIQMDTVVRRRQLFPLQKCRNPSL